MESLLEWAQVSKVNILDTVCAQPASLTGSLVKNLDLSTMNCGKCQLNCVGSPRAKTLTIYFAAQVYHFMVMQVFISKIFADT